MFDPTTVTPGSNQTLPWRCALGHEWRTQPAARHKSGCPVCGNKKVLPGFNDLATTDPDLAAEALFDPTTVTRGSGSRLPWICARGHEWKAPVSRRATGIKSGCPYCANKAVWLGYNDLATVRPDLAEEALFDPTTVTQASGKRVRWKCAQGHEWSAAVSSRAGGTGCPTCAKYGFDVNRQAWLYLLRRDSDDLLQVGITNDTKIRFQAHRRIGWEPVDVRGPMDGVLARDWESSILEMLRSTGVPLGRAAGLTRFSGYTEAWRRSDFPVHSVRALMDRVQEWDVTSAR